MTIATQDFDIRVISLAAIRRAAFDIAGECETQIQMLSEHKARVEFTSTKESGHATEVLLAEFSSKVLDHQVRLEVFEDFRVIREMIVAQAFEPCENIGEVMKTVEP